jgi:hypothetical protein
MTWLTRPLTDTDTDTDTDTRWAGAGTTLMQKTGQVDRTVDSEFSQEEQKYRTLEKSSSLLQKEAKTYLDSIRAMTAAQARLAETIDSFYADNSDAAMAANSYRRAVGELESKTARELDAPFRATVLEPIGKMCSYWPEINKAIEKRNKKVGDYRLWELRLSVSRRGRKAERSVPTRSAACRAPLDNRS